MEEGELNSSAEARKLAFYLFWNIKPYFDRNFIIQEDLEHFLSAKKAAQAFTLLDVDGDGKVCSYAACCGTGATHTAACTMLTACIDCNFNQSLR